VVPSDRTRGSGHKLKHRRFPLHIRKHFSAVKVTEHLHRFPREACGVSVLGDTQNPPGHDPRQPAVGGSA